MENKKQLNVSFEEILIKEVKFKKSENMALKSYKIECSDNIEVVDVNNNGFKLEYTRKTETEEPFTFIVTFECFCKIQGETEFDLEKIKQTAETNKESIVSNLNLPSKASLIIGDITSNLGTPYLSRPYLIKK